MITFYSVISDPALIALLRNYYQIIFLSSVFMRLRKKQLNTEVRVSQTLVIVALNYLLCILFPY